MFKEIFFYSFLLIGLKFFAHLENLEILGLGIMMLIHELGHAFSASMFNRYVEFTFKNLNPSIRHYIYEGEPYTSINKLNIITLSGALFNLLTTPILAPLFEYDWLKYVTLTIAVSILDFYVIIKRKRE